MPRCNDWAYVSFSYYGLSTQNHQGRRTEAKWGAIQRYHPSHPREAPEVDANRLGFVLCLYLGSSVDSKYSECSVLLVPII